MRKYKSFRYILLSAVFCLSSLPVSGDVVSDMDSAWVLIKGYEFDQAEQLYQSVISEYGNTDHADQAVIWSKWLDVFSLIEDKDYDNAQELTDSLLAQDKDKAVVAEMLFTAAEFYRWAGQFEKATTLYDKVVSDYSTDTFAQKAQLVKSWVETFSLVEGDNYSQVLSVVNQLKQSDCEEIDSAQAIFSIAQHYRWLNKLSEANNIYQEVVNTYPNSDFTDKAMWYVLWSDVFTKIDENKESEAKVILDQISADYSDHQDWPEMIFRLADRYRWLADFENADKYYKQLISDYPQSEYADKTRIISLQVQVLTAFDAGNYSKVEEITNNLLSNYYDSNQLPEILYSIAERYRWQGRYDKVQQLYQGIITNYANSSVATKVQLDAPIVTTLSLIEPGNEQQAQAAIDVIISGLSSDERLPETMSLIGERYYTKGCQLTGEGDFESAENYWQQALVIWENLERQFPNVKLPAGAKFWVGECYRKVGEFEKSITCLEKELSEYPESENAWSALFLIGKNYELLARSGAVNSEVNYKAEAHQVYKQLLESYPDCPAAKAAKRGLSR